MWRGRPLRTWLHKECQGCYKHLTHCLPNEELTVYLCQSVSFFHSSIGRKASHHHTVRERKNGKRTPVQDQLLMMPVKLVKGKAPISRIEWTYLGINPKLGVVGLVAMILMIYRSRSTNPMRGVLHLHPRKRTRITRSPAVTTSRLSPHEGTIMVMHHRTRIIHPVQRSTGFRRQDSLPETPMSGLGEVSCARVRFCCSVTNRL